MSDIQESMAIEEKIVNVLKTCYDPEIPVNIYELGLIYEVKAENGDAYIKMTLTSPMCPVAETLPVDVDRKVRTVHGISTVKVDVVWEPPWNPSMMSEAARLELGMV